MRQSIIRVLVGLGVLALIIAGIAVCVLYRPRTPRALGSGVGGGLGATLAGGARLERAANEATYEVTFSTNWGRPELGARYPTGPHTGNMLLVAHGPAFSLFREDSLASAGIVETSMFGTLNRLNALTASAQRQGSVLDAATAPVLQTPGTESFRLRLDSAHSLASFVAMLAPSPDWFFGARDIELLRGQAWVPELEVPVFAWDAGSDSGTEFANEPDYPEPVQQRIGLLGAPLWPGEARPVASLQFRRVE